MIIHQSLTECKQPFAFNDIGVKSIDNAHTETFWYDNKDSFITWVILYEIQWSKGPKFSSQSPISHSFCLCLSLSLVLFITLSLLPFLLYPNHRLLFSLSLSYYSSFGLSYPAILFVHSVFGLMNVPLSVNFHEYLTTNWTLPGRI